MMIIAMLNNFKVGFNFRVVEHANMGISKNIDRAMIFK